MKPFGSSLLVRQLRFCNRNDIRGILGDKHFDVIKGWSDAALGGTVQQSECVGREGVMGVAGTWIF